MPKAFTNGFTTFYETEGSGHPLVLVHGHTADLRLWDDQISALSPNFRLIRYDVRGHGRSEAPSTGYTWPIYAEDLRQLLSHLGVEQAHLLGLSMGGGIALQFALDNPEMVSALVLADSALEGFSYSDEFAEPWEEMINVARSEGVQKALAEVWLNHPLFDGIKRYPEKWRRLRQMTLSFSGVEYRDTSARDEAGLPQIGRLHEVAAPTLVLVGEDDIQDFRLISEILAGGIANAEKITIPGSGHVLNMEAPEAFNQAVAAFLSSV
jgi:pimeloyl-ACP methyl ester carboxylesterase